ncbi:MAG: phage tail protein [Lachnospiraceae bacterium]
MNEALKYFVFNKISDYENGCCINISIDNRGIRVKDDESIVRGTFISPVLDSEESEMIWHRALIQSELQGESSISITFYSSDTRNIYVEGKWLDLQDIIQNKELSLQKKIDILAPSKKLQVFHPKDILLHKLVGRYVVLRIDLIKQYQVSPVLYTIKLYLPKQSWVTYLPEIYQKNENEDFLERFLAMFVSLHQDMTDAINHIPRYLDPDTVPKEFLEWLGEWIGITDSYLWNEAQLRTLQKQAVNLYKIRGTKQSMEAMIELYTGEKPLIVEGFEINQFKEKPETYDKMKHFYSEDPYAVSVLVREEVVTRNVDYMQLSKIVSMTKPAHVEVHLIVLKQNMHLNQHIFVGVNSNLGNLQSARLDGTTAIPYAALEDNKKDKDKEE